MSKELETLRADGKIKGGLTADVAIYANTDIFEQLSRLEELVCNLLPSSAELISKEPCPCDRNVSLGIIIGVNGF
ncbi:MAG: hypothetical protein Q9N32_07765 [Gammaproteobacteria bacterium]|nr:hypothetical protein [Gammaproteobacteria bacterium]